VRPAAEIRYVPGVISRVRRSSRRRIVPGDIVDYAGIVRPGDDRPDGNRPSGWGERGRAHAESVRGTIAPATATAAASTAGSGSIATATARNEANRQHQHAK